MTSGVVQTGRQLIVMKGTPTEGFYFYGPFQNEQEANRWSAFHARLGGPYAPTFTCELESVQDEKEVEEAESKLAHGESAPAIVITGNLVDGLYFYGPISDESAAREWARAELHDQYWLESRLWSGHEAACLPDAPSP